MDGGNDLFTMQCENVLRICKFSLLHSKSKPSFSNNNCLLESEMATTNKYIIIVKLGEDGMDLVDFLYGVFELPLGSIMGLLWENGVVGSECFGSVYSCVIKP